MKTQYTYIKTVSFHIVHNVCFAKLGIIGFKHGLFVVLAEQNEPYTDADYWRFTVLKQLKTLSLCILLLTPAIEVIFN